MGKQLIIAIDVDTNSLPFHLKKYRLPQLLISHIKVQMKNVSKIEKLTSRTPDESKIQDSKGKATYLDGHVHC